MTTTTTTKTTLKLDKAKQQRKKKATREGTGIRDQLVHILRSPVIVIN